MIEVSDLVVRYGDVVAVKGISFTVMRGEHLTLLGPSGCGKTTTLRAIAGLEPPLSGSIRLNGRTAYSSTERRNIEAEKRGLSMVFQSYAIWPHMSVFENVAYGLRVRRLTTAAIEAAVARALSMVDMSGFAKRSASKLSGGQQQRVALARAIAFSPEIVLFDEPLSNLDAKLRGQMRLELAALQHQLAFTSVYVTHDQEEALAISDQVIVMKDGRIEQVGTPEEIYNRPRSRFVADFVGSANLLEGRVKGPVDSNGEILFETTRGLLLRTCAPVPPTGSESAVALRTTHINLEPASGDANANHAPGMIRQKMFHGDFVEYLVDWSEGCLTVRRPPTDRYEAGQSVSISFSPQHCVLLSS